MKYYSVIIRSKYSESEKAVLVKANDKAEVRQLAKPWHGIIMNIVEVVPPGAYLNALVNERKAETNE